MSESAAKEKRINFNIRMLPRVERMLRQAAARYGYGISEFVEIALDALLTDALPETIAKYRQRGVGHDLTADGRRIIDIRSVVGLKMKPSIIARLREAGRRAMYSWLVEIAIVNIIETETDLAQSKMQNAK